MRLLLCFAASLLLSLPSPAQTDAERAAVDKGVAFLLKAQDPSGAWLSDEYGMGSPGHKTAITCACLHALLEHSRSPEALKAARKALEFLSATVKDLGKGVLHDGFKFSVWGPAYGLLHLHGVRARWPAGEPFPDVKPLIEAYVEYAKSMQTPSGGWDYRGDAKDGSVSFLTGVMVDGLLKWKDELKIDQAFIDRALTDLGRMARNGCYQYFHDGKYDQDAAAVESSGRNVGIQLALVEGGKAKPETLQKYLDDMFKVREEFIKVRNEHPHTPPHYIAGYYYYHSLYYAARTIAFLGSDLPGHVKEIRSQLLKEQAAEGSWIDAPCGGRTYGTALALLCFRDTERLVSPFADSLDAALAKAKQEGRTALAFFTDGKPDSLDIEKALTSAEFSEIAKGFSCVKIEIRKDDPACKAAMVTAGPVILLLNPGEAKPLAKPLRKYSGKRPAKTLKDDLTKALKELTK